jgi:hypothetical protein
MRDVDGRFGVLVALLVSELWALLVTSFTDGSIRFTSGEMSFNQCVEKTNRNHCHLRRKLPPSRHSIRGLKLYDRESSHLPNGYSRTFVRFMT